MYLADFLYCEYIKFDRSCGQHDCVTITLVTCGMANCCCANAQAPIQAFFRPSVWIPGVKNLHSFRERWIIDGATPDKCLEDVTQAVEKVDTGEHLVVNKVDKERHFIQIFSFTAANWLDVVEIRFHATSEKRTEGDAYSFSSGLIPVCCPLSFVFNAIFCWVPFWDHNFNQRRLMELKKAMSIQVSAVESKNCC